MNTHQQNVSGKTPFQPFYLPKRTLQEHNRLTFQHHVLRTVLGGNFLAPCAHPAAILDVVCGTGAWTADMGKLFPKAEIIGMDIVSPSCPQSSHFQFIEGHTPLALPFNDARFDYVHQRCLSVVIPAVHWQGIVHELVRVTQPDGWVELMEYGSSYTNAGPATEQFCLWWQAVLTKQGIDLKAMEHLGQLLQDAGLTHVEQKKVPIPLSGGRAGDAMRTNLLAMMQNARTGILALGVDQMAFDKVMGALLKEWQEYETTYQFHAAYGQRESHKTLFSQASHQRAVRELHVRGSRLPNAHKVRQLAESHV